MLGDKTAASDRPRRPVANKAAGDRLAKTLRMAMVQAGIETWEQLGIESGVSPTTVDNWIYGVTYPRGKKLAAVAKRLDPYTSMVELDRAYQGLPPLEPPLIEVLREIAPDLHELLVLMRAQYDQAEREAFRSALEERRSKHGAFRVIPPDTPSGGTSG